MKAIEQVSVGQSVVVDGVIWTVARAWGNGLRHALNLTRQHSRRDHGTRVSARDATLTIARDIGAMVQIV